MGVIWSFFRTESDFKYRVVDVVGFSIDFEHPCWNCWVSDAGLVEVKYDFLRFVLHHTMPKAFISASDSLDNPLFLSDSRSSSLSNFLCSYHQLIVF